VTNPHAENFLFAYTYTAVPRWWFEQIGYWGPPGTPPPDEEKPIPIKPINVPSLQSPAEYEAAYPRGFDQPYPWTPPLVASSSPYSEKSTRNATMVSTAVTFIMGITIGGSVVALLMKHSQRSYLPIK
jgi:hypothetical protein